MPLPLCLSAPRCGVVDGTFAPLCTPSDRTVGP